MKNLITLAALLISISVEAQKWIDLMHQPGHSFYEIQSAFYDYWKDRDTRKKGHGYKQFKRWEARVEPRVYPSGDLSLLSTNWKNFEEFVEANPRARMMSVSTWTAMGPFGPMTGVANNGLPRKAGRDNFITFHPASTNTFWVGAPAGGLWKTTNAGSTWTTNTDNLPVIGCSDLAVDPVTPTTMYLATGDGDAGDTYCIGVLKSTDGGNSWNATGLSFNVNQQRQMRRLVINPQNPQILLAATNAGIWRTTNGGTSWTQVATFDAFDVEFNPLDPTRVFATGTAFYRSTNGGASFSIVSNGIATSGSNRMSVAVTPADTAYVYVLASSSSSGGLLGFYRSTNGGISFTNVFSSPDILANSCSSPSGGGQGWYDLALAASPLNKNEVAVGGVNVWRSLNGGSSFSIIGCWTGASNPPYLHADQHDLEYDASGVLYSCSDGGISRYTGSAWTDLSSPRNIAQIYKIGLSGITPNKWITGHQDNGSNVYTNGVYQARLAGDGMDCFIDRTNDNNQFASQYNGSFYRSVNGGATWNAATTGMSGSGAWVSPWKQDPVVATRLYAGLSQLYVSNNLGVSWTLLGNTGGSGNIVEFAIAPSNNQVIYAIRGYSVRKSTNGGSTWTSVTGSIPISLAAPSFVTIDPSDENHVWVTMSGYAGGNKVFETTNGGTSWQNVSFNLPNLPANCSVYQPGSNDLVFVGMDVGVYYKDNSSTSWTLYNNGLPNVPVHDMEISAAAPTKLRAATYGRGVYEVSVVLPTAVPGSSFNVSGQLCEGSTLALTDASSNGPTNWSWTVQPAGGATLTSGSAQNPSLQVQSAGVYTISLVASNAVGNGNQATQTITVSALPQFSVNAPPFICAGDEVTLSATSGPSYTWSPGNIASPQVTFTAALQPYSYTVAAVSSEGCAASQTIDLTVSECTGALATSSADGSVRIYPNPFSAKIHVLVRSAAAVEAMVTLTDGQGKTVVEQPASLRPGYSNIELNTQALPSGTYQLRYAPMNGGAQVFKLVKL